MVILLADADFRISPPRRCGAPRGSEPDRPRCFAYRGFGCSPGKRWVSERKADFRGRYSFLPGHSPIGRLGEGASSSSSLKTRGVPARSGGARSAVGLVAQRAAYGSPKFSFTWPEVRNLLQLATVPSTCLPLRGRPTGRSTAAR